MPDKSIIDTQKPMTIEAIFDTVEPSNEDDDDVIASEDEDSRP